ncbi:DUF2631 domain-containing protein [Pseudonocardia sp. RS010]|uniref:DUF2631 domain-containing protein n=1 Tax=Pseudonocardia sp. RS010 TaxID=3385979 RepID=UPI0039A11670
MASSSRELAKVDPADEPSAEWGWHGTFPKATSIAGIVVAIVLCLLLIGHSTSVTEILFTVIPAAVIFFGVLYGNLRRRKDWRH